MPRVFCKCGCGRSLAGMRANAVWYSDACRMRAKRPQNPNTTRNRRASRDGKGVRIYIAPNDSTLTILLKASAARARQGVTA